MSAPGPYGPPGYPAAQPPVPPRGPMPPAGPPVGPPPGPGWAPPAPRRRPGSRGGLAVVLILVGVVLLCGGLGATGYLLVARIPAGAPQPTSAVSRLLDAVFDKADETTADRYVCDGARDGQTAQRLRQRAHLTNTDTTKITWTDPTQDSRNGDSATVSTSLTLPGSGTADSSQQKWQFSVVDEGGWRVCGLTVA
jgi:hypothetical protein